MTIQVTISTLPLLRCPFCKVRLYRIDDNNCVTVKDVDGNRHTFRTDRVATFCNHCKHEFETTLTT